MKSNSSSVNVESVLLIICSVLLLYLFSVPVSIKWYMANVPSGDGFTYASGYFQLLDEIHNNGYLAEVHRIFRSPWRYWNQPLLVAIFSPLLVKQAFSLAIINFVALLLSTVAMYRLYWIVTKSSWISLLLAFGFWFYPCSYGFAGAPDVNLLSLSIDFVHVHTIAIAVATTLTFALNPSNLVHALIAGVCSGIAVWSRGNSPPYLAISICIPVFFVLYQSFWQKRGDVSRVRLGLVAYLILALLLTRWFYLINYEAIRTYYSAAFSGEALAGGSFEKAITSLSQYRDGFFRLAVGEHRYQNWVGQLWLRNVLCILPNAFAIFATWYCWMPSTRMNEWQRRSVRLIVTNGLFLFFGIFLFLTVGLRVILQEFGLATFMPMAIGFQLIVSACVLRFSFERDWRIESSFRRRAVAITVLLLACSITVSPIDRSNLRAGVVSGRDMEMFSIGIDRWADPGKLAFLWYGTYNRSVINYFRIKNDLPPYQVYENEFFDALWIPTGPPNKERMTQALDKIFSEADFIILPEKLSSYADGHVFPLNTYPVVLDDFLNSRPRLPFKIRERIIESSSNSLLLLERIDPKDKCVGCELFNWPLRKGP